MDNKFCFNGKIFIIAIIMIILSSILAMILYIQNNRKNNYVTIVQNQKQKPRINFDSVREYDYDKIYDILEEPTRRVERHEIPNIMLKNRIDIATRGYPDTYKQMGILIKTKSDKNDGNYGITENNIIRLFGRQKYPTSKFYEYYANIYSSYDQIKIPLKIRKDELYDDDIVYIKELDSKYRVQLFKFDAPRYYPIIY